jgi:monomeric isocitrate dehydrogenase
MSKMSPTIIYTLTDEALALATAAFLPIVRAFTAPAGINVATLVNFTMQQLGGKIDDDWLLEGLVARMQLPISSLNG